MEENTSNAGSLFAGFFKRGGSVFLDLFLVMIVFSILNLPFSISGSWHYSSSFGSGLVTSVMYKYPFNALLFLVVLIIYFTLTEFLWGASVGKLIFRERVVSLQKEKISLGVAFLRNIFTPIDLILGHVFFLFSTKNQTLGDKVANTIVINKKLADLPIVDEPISLARKICAILFVVIATLFFVLTVWIISKVLNFNEHSRVVVENFKEKSGTDIMGLYKSFAPEFTESISFEKFEEALSPSEFRDALMSVNVNKISFYSWRFNKNQAVVFGEQNDVIIRLSFIKNDIGEWKLEGFYLMSGSGVRIFSL